MSIFNNQPGASSREDDIYKDIFFKNATAREYLVEALIYTYVDCEKTGYYEKINSRYMNCVLLEYLFSEKYNRNKLL